MPKEAQANTAAVEDDILLAVLPNLLAVKVSFPFVPEIANPASADMIRKALGGDYSSIRLESGQDNGPYERASPPPGGALRDVVWCLSERDSRVFWKVALSPDSAELEARDCGNAPALLDRLAALVSKIRELFSPGCCSRVGMRMFCETTERAAGGMVRTECLGPVWPVGEKPLPTVAAIGPSRSETVFRTEGGTVVKGRWGQLSNGDIEDADAAGDRRFRDWALDVSLHRSEALPFDAGAVRAEAAGISGTLSQFVSSLVTDGFRMNRGLFPMSLFREGEGIEPGPRPAGGGRDGPPGPARTVAEIRRVSGLVWEEIAGLFGVTRRTVHNWAGGTGMTRRRQEQARRLLEAMRRMGRGTDGSARELLMQAGAPGGRTRFDLLKEGRYDQALAGVEDLGAMQEASGLGGGSALAPAAADRPEAAPDVLPEGPAGGDREPEPERKGEEAEDPLHPLDAILEIRIMPGLTWEQVDELFGEDPNTVRGWTSGEPMTEEQRALMYRMLAVMMHLYRGSGIGTYELLMSVEPESGMTRFDLMKERRFDEALSGVRNLGVKRYVNQTPVEASAAPLRRSLKEQFSRIDEPDAMSIVGQRLEAELVARERKELEDRHVKAGGKLAPRPESLGQGDEDLLSPYYMLAELRINSGLDEKEVAELFGVPWATTNSWIGSQPMTLEQWELMDRLRATMMHLRRGRTDETRELLMEVVQKSGKSRFELLKDGRFDEALAGIEDLGLGRKIFENPSLEALNFHEPVRPLKSRIDDFIHDGPAGGQEDGGTAGNQKDPADIGN